MNKSVTKWHLITAAIIVLALCMRLPLLTGSFWLDEAAQALESIRPFHQQLDIIPDFQPPLLHFIVHFATYISTQEWWLRLWGALLPGTLSILVTMAIARQLKAHQATSAFAGLLLSLSSFHIFYSQELRPYALPMLWATLSWYFLIKSCRDTRSCVPTTVGYALATTAGLYSSYLYPFLVVSQCVWVLASYPKQLLKTISALVVSGLLFAPWLPWFFAQLEAGQLLRVELPGWSEAVSTPQLKALPLTAAKLLFGVVDLELNAAWIALSLALVLLSLWQALKYLRSFSTLKEALNSRAFLYFCWLTVPILTSWLISFVVPVLQPKRMLLVQPALFLLLAELAFTTHSRKERRLGGEALLLILLLTQLFGTYRYWTDPQLQRENWRGLAQEIRAKYPRAAVVMSFPAPFAPWAWYAPHFPAITTQTINTSLIDSSDLENRLTPAQQHSQILQFEYLDDLTDSQQRVSTHLRAWGYKDIGVIDYPLIGFVRLWEQPEPAELVSLQYLRSKPLEANESAIVKTDAVSLSIVPLNKQYLYIDAQIHQPNDAVCTLTGTMRLTDTDTYTFQDQDSTCSATLTFESGAAILDDPTNSCTAYWCGAGGSISKVVLHKKEAKYLDSAAEEEIKASPEYSQAISYLYSQYAPATPRNAQILEGMYSQSHTITQYYPDPKGSQQEAVVDSLQIIAFDTNSYYVQTLTFHENNHSCSLSGLFIKNSDTSYQFQDPESTCQATVSISETGLMLDDPELTCHHWCGARGYIAQQQYSFSSRRDLTDQEKNTLKSEILEMLFSDKEKL